MQTHLYHYKENTGLPQSEYRGEVYAETLWIQLKGVVALLDKQHIGIEITEKAKNLLATRGFTPKYGARQVAGTIRNYIRRPISKMIVAGTLTAGNTVVVDVAENGEIDWNVK